MLEALLGSQSRERVLIFIFARQRGYATEIARFFKTRLFSIQNQLDRLEREGVLISELSGRTRLYQFNPRYAFLAELEALLDKALSMYPESERQDLLLNRRRPRRRGKPL